MGDHHSREQIHEVKAALKKDGTITAIDDSITVDMGVFQPTGGIASTLVTAKMVPGPYKIKNYRVRLTGVSTNKSPFGANRGFGKESAALVHERIMDYASEKLGIDPVEIRLRNFIQRSDFPYVNASGEKYDSGDYDKTFSKLLTLIGYADFRKKQQDLRKKNKHIGVGLTFVLCPSSLSNRDNLYTGWDSASVTMDPSGYITVMTGLTSPGTGHEVVYSQVVADELGVELSSIRVMEGDTLACPYGSGNWTDRGATIGASAVLLAARKLGVKLRKIGGALLDLSDKYLGLRDGYVFSLDEPSRRVSFSEIAWVAHASPHKLPPEVEPGLTEIATFTLKPSEIDRDGKWGLYQIVSSAATAAIVEVDPETFQIKILRYVMVDDSGVLINPAVVHGQLVGAAAQGISSSFLEELTYQDGQLLTPTLMDYKLATAVEVPDIEVDQIETPSPYTLMGAKGAGEGGIVAPYAALCSAVEDAIRPLGIRIAETPLKSEKFWRESFSAKLDFSKRR
jgi:carbon-monoxide dehydrogenase large subunit